MKGDRYTEIERESAGKNDRYAKKGDRASGRNYAEKGRAVRENSKKEKSIIPKGTQGMRGERRPPGAGRSTERRSAR